jgi:hypothetical protein
MSVRFHPHAEGLPSMKPIFSVHAGEYLVATHIEENYKHLNVWLPSKDTGVDILVTDKANRRTLSLQVKFSNDFLGSLGNSTSDAVVAKVKAGGWWTFNQKKLSSSVADLWILVLYRFTKRDYDFIIMVVSVKWWKSSARPSAGILV